MKELLNYYGFLWTISILLLPVQTINGVIWDKGKRDFIPIFSIPSFGVIKEQLFHQSRLQETHNFQGMTVKLTYFEERNIVNFIKNKTAVSGYAGEIWNTLAEALNFTLKPILLKTQSNSAMRPDKTYTGALGILQRNETDVVPKVEMYSNRLYAAQLTLPLWKTTHRLYIRRKAKHDHTWLLKLFSRDVWYAIIIVYVCLSIFSFISQLLRYKITKTDMKASIDEHLFYNFGLMCHQSFIPSMFRGRSKLLELFLGLYSYLVSTAFCALLIGYMTQKVIIPPFTGLHSMLHTTPYRIAVAYGSFAHVLFEKGDLDVFIETRKLKRFDVVETLEDVYIKACSETEKYAMLESEAVKKAQGLFVCRLNPVQKSYYSTWIGSGIAWNFEYKKSIDIGILKLYEHGIFDLLKYRWIESKNIEEEHPRNIEPIGLDQILLILVTFVGGIFISLIVLILEIAFVYRKKRLCLT